MYINTYYIFYIVSEFHAFIRIVKEVIKINLGAACTCYGYVKGSSVKRSELLKDTMRRLNKELNLQSSENEPNVQTTRPRAFICEM